MRSYSLVFGLLLAIAPTSALAQTHLVRGFVERIPSTNRYRLGCTNDVILVSHTLDLQLLADLSRTQGVEYAMQASVVSFGGTSMLDIASAVPALPLFDMGPLRSGQVVPWEVRAPSGSLVAIYVSPTSSTLCTPFGVSGTWVLPTSAVHLVTGLSAGGRFRYSFLVPELPEIVGLSFTAQAIYVDIVNVVLTNPDCKAVR